MLDETTKSIKATLYERISSPLIGAFVLSWIGWNYRFFMALFSDEKLNDKFTIINELFAEGRFYTYGIKNPFLTAAFFIIIVPILSNIAYAISRSHQLVHGIIREKFDQVATIPASELHKLEDQASQDKFEYHENIKKKDDEIEFLRKENKQLTTDLKIMSEEPKVSTQSMQDGSMQDGFQPAQVDQNKLEGLEEDILIHISNNNERARVSLLRNKFNNMNLTTLNHYIDTLRSGDYIIYDNDDIKNSLLLRPRGREYLVKNNLLDNPS